MTHFPVNEVNRRQGQALAPDARESMAYDIVIVGAGPAGLAAAIHLKQLAVAESRTVSVCVLEKGAEVGAHILSGAVIDPRGINRLCPDWQAQGAPLETPVTKDQFFWLTKSAALPIPNITLPPLMKNHGFYIASLGQLTRWMAQQAEALGVEIYPGFAAAELLFDEEGRVYGVATGDMGVSKSGAKKDNWQAGMELHAKYTLLAEGAHGSLSKAAIAHFKLAEQADYQKYGLGIKELWQLAPDKHRPGYVQHTLGWPLDDKTGGGSFLYHFGDNYLSIGFVTHLNYENPYLSPYDEFQRFKMHPFIRKTLTGGKRIAYGARAITEGGWQSVPKLVFAGGALVGCAAGFVNVPRIKGSHNAIETGMLAAQAAYDAISAGRAQDELTEYQTAYQLSDVARELKQVRNVKPLLSRFGNLFGTLLGGLDMWMRTLKIGLPYTLSHGKPDHACLKKANLCRKIDYPKPDNIVSFDKLSSVFLSATNHEENQPPHLTLADPELPTKVTLPDYDEPAQRYCPAGVYEIVESEGGGEGSGKESSEGSDEGESKKEGAEKSSPRLQIIWNSEGSDEGDGKKQGAEKSSPRLQINAQNCVHCKTCDIKDPMQNINWVVPEGGGGPTYPNM
ncbi:MAG: electron transfer flavoprotein-ubiquinone oxidoreductase [Alphaproteobacteria bacterium]|nr:electron transfer flavoprotein-ubiquinone oxidoreductase [Alphaproteobacteria bacterium]